jgi:hypothetical protein
MRFVFCAVLILLIQGCAQRIQKPMPDSNQKQAVTSQPSVKGFQPVKEMLSANCSPCHVSGGKMYERLPFDNAEIVRAHSDRISGRLNKPEDKKILEDWLSEPQL